jgi:hypothetical protein
MIYRRYTSDNIKTMEGSIANYELALKGIRTEINRNNNKSAGLKYSVDAILFHTLYGYDVAVLYKNFMLAKTAFEQTMTSRLVASLLYEFMNDSFEVMGKNLEQTVSPILKDFNGKTELKDVKRKLSSFKEKYFLKFQTIRNTVGAHRDHDPHLQLEVIEQIVIEETEFSVKEFLSLNGELYNYYLSLLVRIENQEKSK